MSTDLPEFSGEFTHCTMCDSAEADVEYVGPASGFGRDRFNGTGDVHPSSEFLKRTCTFCGYEWPEATRRERPKYRRCQSHNLGDVCEMTGGHVGNHRYGGREWFITGGQI